MIHVLDEGTINLIAAGEVVERPLSVVKELVENAIDAASSAITVEIKGGGIDFIRVTDNGSGIISDEISTAFLRHATSKISDSDDLNKIHSLGFRGEALSSICAVAKIELITRTHDSISGYRYVLEGDFSELSEIGAPEGTTLIIRDLFYNTPARREFLKSATTEGRVIEECMEHFCLSHPNIRWQFISDGKNKLSTSGDGSLKSGIFHAFGNDVAKALVPIEVSDEATGIRLYGFIAKPEFSRGNRAYMNYFVNGRYIRSQIIAAAILDGYRDYLMNHRYPFTALCLDIPAEKMDVNVHPAKLEVRFSDEKTIYELIFHAVKNALDSITLIPEESLDTAADKKSQPINNRINKQNITPDRSLNNDLKPQQINDKNKEQYIAADKSLQSEVNTRLTDSAGQTQNEIKPVGKIEPFEQQRMKLEFVKENYSYDEEKNAPSQFTEENIFRISDVPEFRIIGQVFDTYWLIEYKDELLIIDQHAAHEKVLYEHFVAKMREKKGLSQKLLAPIVVSLSGREQDVLNMHFDAFYELGFRLESFGEREYIISSVPADFLNVDAKELFIDILDTFLDEQKGKKPEMVLDHLATIACKAAVKGNNTLSYQEAKTLIGEMLALDEPYHCPHGRPTTIAMSKYEFEKKFKRIV